MDLVTYYIENREKINLFVDVFMYKERDLYQHELRRVTKDVVSLENRRQRYASNTPDFKNLQRRIDKLNAKSDRLTHTFYMQATEEFLKAYDYVNNAGA